jgi:glutaredoxin-related protein
VGQEVVIHRKTVAAFVKMRNSRPRFDNRDPENDLALPKTALAFD